MRWLPVRLQPTSKWGADRQHRRSDPRWIQTLPTCAPACRRERPSSKQASRGRKPPITPALSTAFVGDDEEDMPQHIHDDAGRDDSHGWPTDLFLNERGSSSPLSPSPLADHLHIAAERKAPQSVPPQRKPSGKAGPKPMPTFARERHSLATAATEFVEDNEAQAAGDLKIVKRLPAIRASTLSPATPIIKLRLRLSQVPSDTFSSTLSSPISRRRGGLMLAGYQRPPQTRPESMAQSPPRRAQL